MQSGRDIGKSRSGETDTHIGVAGVIVAQQGHPVMRPEFHTPECPFHPVRPVPISGREPQPASRIGRSSHIAGPEEMRPPTLILNSHCQGRRKVETGSKRGGGELHIRGQVPDALWSHEHVAVCGIGQATANLCKAKDTDREDIVVLPPARSRNTVLLIAVKGIKGTLLLNIAGWGIENAGEPLHRQSGVLIGLRWQGRPDSEAE